MKRDYEIIDVCHTVEDGMITYKGLPAPVITDHLTRAASKQVYEAGTEFHIGKIEMVANTGTYLDSPFHRYADGADLAGLDLYSLANLDGLVVRRVDAPARDLIGCNRGVRFKGQGSAFSHRLGSVLANRRLF